MADDAEQFDWDTCLRVLQQHCPLSAPLLRSHVLEAGRSQASYFNAGARAGSQSGICNFTFQHELLVKYVNLFLRTIFLEATWTSFCISHNEFAHLHSDLNFPGSLHYTCSLGPFDQGRLWVQLPAECLPHLERVPPPDSTADSSLRGVLVSTRRSGFSFDGRLLHCSEPWSGDRWVITAYTSGNHCRGWIRSVWLIFIFQCRPRRVHRIIKCWGRLLLCRALQRFWIYRRFRAISSLSFFRGHLGPCLRPFCKLAHR